MNRYTNTWGIASRFPFQWIILKKKEKKEQRGKISPELQQKMAI